MDDHGIPFLKWLASGLDEMFLSLGRHHGLAVYDWIEAVVSHACQNAREKLEVEILPKGR